MRAVTRGGDKTTPALNAEIELTTGSQQPGGGRGLYGNTLLWANGFKRWCVGDNLLIKRWCIGDNLLIKRWFIVANLLNCGKLRDHV